MLQLAFEFGIHLLIGTAVFYLVYSFLEEVGRTTEELKSARTDKVESSLSDLYLSLSPRSFFSIRLASAAVLFLLGFLALDFILGLCLGLVGYFLPTLYVRKLRRQRVAIVEQQLVEGLELLRNALRSGLTLQQSSELLVSEFPPPISQEFSVVIAEARLGVDFTEALQNMADRLDSPIVKILATGVAITKKCGGDLGEIFGNLAETIREQARIEGKLNAVTSQGRTQGLVLGAMPFLLLIALYFIDPSHVETLFGNQVGVYAFSAVIAMVLMAQLWIRKLMNIDV